jgi:hypothetical protein
MVEELIRIVTTLLSIGDEIHRILHILSQINCTSKWGLEDIIDAFICVAY